MSASSAYPEAPWQMHGQLWLSLFRLPHAVDELRPAGTYGVALVDYQAPSPLTYSELLVARPITEPTKGVTITDIWVDSPASVAGGRELWAIPKGLADFDGSSTRRGPMSSVTWSASADGQPICSARFTDVSRATVRLPFRGATWQPGIDDTAGEDRRATLRGSAKTLPARAHWEFDAQGPLGWLAGLRTVASFRMADFSMRFG